MSLRGAGRISNPFENDFRMTGQDISEPLRKLLPQSNRSLKIEAPVEYFMEGAVAYVFQAKIVAGKEFKIAKFSAYSRLNSIVKPVNLACFIAKFEIIAACSVSACRI